MKKFLNSPNVTEKKSGYIPEWVMELEPVRNLPTNVGSRIRKCICRALEKDPPEWAKKRLKLSISKQVYNRNASGPTKRAVVSLLTDFEEEIVQENLRKKRKMMMTMKEKEDEVCVVNGVDDLVMKKIEEEVCIVDGVDDLVMKKIEEEVCVVDGVDDLVMKEKIVKEVCVIDGVDDLVMKEKIEKEVCVVDSVADLVMKQCRIVLRRVAAEDEDRIFCSFLKLNGNDDEGLIGCLDFESIDSRLVDGFYCGSHEAFYDDVQQIWRSIGTLFIEQPGLIKLGERLGKIFEEMYDKEVLTIVRKYAEGDESLARVGEILIPKAPWEEGICKVCGMDKDDGNVLLCVGCESEYRRCCLNPSLVKIPEVNWYCPSCASGKSTLNSSGVNSRCMLEKGKNLNELANAMIFNESRESNREEMAGKKKKDDISKGKRPAKESIKSRTKVCKSFRPSGSIQILDQEHRTPSRRIVQTTLLRFGQRQMGFQDASHATIQRIPEHEQQEMPAQVEESAHVEASTLVEASAQDPESSCSDSDGEPSVYDCNSESSDSSSEADDDLMIPAASRGAIQYSQHLGKTSQVRKSGNVELNPGSKGTWPIQKPSKGPPKEGDTLPIATIHAGHFTSTSAAGQKLISTYLTSYLRRKLRKFWPRWKNVPDKKRDKLWEALKEEVDMSEVQENYAKRCFMKDNNPRYRNFLSKLKITTMDERGLTHPTQLRGTSPPDWMPRRVWNKYIEHWCSEKQLKKSEQGRSARLSTDGRDGEISKSGYGRVGPGDRQLREREKTGSQPPIHKIMCDVNEKRDKSGRVIKVVDRRTAKALKEAKEKYMTLEMHDPAAQYIPDEFMAEVYLGSEVVKEGLNKNRVLGCGSLDQALPLMKVRPPSSCNGKVGAVDLEIYAEMQRLRERDEERELQIREARERERQLQEEAYQLQAKLTEAEIRRQEESRQLQESIAEAERLRLNMAQTQLSMSMQARLESLESLVNQRFFGDHSASVVSQTTTSSHSDGTQQYQQQTQLPSDQITPPPSSTPNPPIS